MPVARRRVTTLVNATRDAGEYEVAWDGETDSGPARRGIYYGASKPRRDAPPRPSSWAI